MFICIEQNQTNIWGSTDEKLGNTEGEFKKGAACIKK